jgi:two-component system, chemotaxis family, protein-glutamate methylesterase/glutaminase
MGPLAAARCAVVLAASTGGPRTLVAIAAKLPSPLPAAVVIVQHLPQAFAASLAERLAAACSFPVALARDGEPILASRGYVAPGGYHLLVEGAGRDSGRVALLDVPSRAGVRPSADLAMASASEVFGPRTIGVVLSGMGRDGADGAVAIKSRGGRVIAEAPDVATIPWMPRAAIATGAVDVVLPADEIPGAIAKMLGRLR